MSVGEAFEDLVFHGLPRLPRPGEELRTRGFSRTWGGGTLITGVAAARLGIRVVMASALADGAVRRLRAEGVTVRNLRRQDEAHAVTVALSTRHERTFVTVEAANEALEARVLALLGEGWPRARHVHLALGPRNLAAWVPVLAGLRARGVGTSWDFGWHESLPRQAGFRELLAELDWVFVNEHEARHYAGAPALARAVARWRSLARRTIVKRGARGAVAVLGESTLPVIAPAVKVVDTTGAGDAFNGGFLAALLRGRSIEDCLRMGALVGSLSTRAAGGIDALPTLADLAEAGSRFPAAGSRRSK